MKFFYLLLFLSIVHFSTFAQDLSVEEKKLYDLVMQHRKEQGLAEIPLSKSLTFVAQTHAKDMEENPATGDCNLHSWSNKGKWTPCCYTDDHKQAACMWNKPKELTSYKGIGFEIAHWSTYGTDAQTAFYSWKNSLAHDAVMINAGVWKDQNWKAIGIGIFGSYAVIWFGTAEDVQ
jgi:uncharacterized protein YkwD